MELVVCILIAMAVAATVVLIKLCVHKEALIHSKSWTKSIHENVQSSHSTFGSTRSLSIAVPSPTGRRIFHVVLTLAKNKYGGPFTNEEVEDTKTFLRILPLLLCLFGYHLAGDGYSAPEAAPEDQLSLHYQY